MFVEHDLADRNELVSVRLWWRHVEPAAVERGESALDELDQARRDRFTHVDAREHMVSSRGLLADGLGRCGLSLGPLQRGDRGKPSLVDGPEFNLSHSNGVVALALVSGEAQVAVGIDVEAPWRSTDIDAIKNRYFAASEVESLDRFDDAERREKFFELWTLKEAVLKATGKGLSVPLSSVVFELGERWELRDGLEGPWSLAQWTLETGHILSAAAPAESVDWRAPELLVVRTRSSE